MNAQMIHTSLLRCNEGQLEGLPSNPRYIKDEKFELLKRSLQESPEMLHLRELLVYPHGDTYIVIGGNMRLRAAEELGIEELPCKVLPPYTTVAKLREYTIKDNNGYGDYDWDILANEWDEMPLADWGVDMPAFEEMADGGEETASDGGDKESNGGGLCARFVVPPFSTLDTRQGYWQDRKKMWRAFIGDMGESREDKLIHSPEMKYPELYAKSQKQRAQLGISFAEYLEKYVSDEEKEKYKKNVSAAGVSLFDPVLSEIACKWFAPYVGGKIFDCFAGDAQKGLVFAQCGYDFTGIELRQEQVDVNNKVIEGRGLPIRYICDDGQNVAKHIQPNSMDMLFSCPPYYDLEVYSDLENDASNQGSYEDFLNILRKAFGDSIKCLKDNRFAVVVVGDVRNKKSGCYQNFVADTKRIFIEQGMALYNELILIEAIHTARMRAGNYMDSRKVAKTHQNVLVFYKGNPKDIKGIFPKIEYSEEDVLQFESQYCEE